MRFPACVRLILIAAIAATLPQRDTVRAADPPTSPADAAKLDKILGQGGGEAWKITPPTYATSDEPAIVGGAPAGVRLESKEKVAAPSEFYYAFRLKPEKAKTTGMQFQMGCAERADKTPQSLTVNVSYTEGAPRLTFSASVQGVKPPVSQAGVQHLAPVADRSLGWSEDLRKIVEAQMAAAPKASETVFVVRCSVEKGRFQTWLNGRFACDLALEPDFDPSGLVRVSVSNGAELVAMRMKPLAPVAARFEPLSIAGNLTGSTILGKKVDQSSLPGANVPTEMPDRTADFDGVPFRFTKAAADGNDHIDVGTSWSRFGAVPGYIAANFGSFGGRWISADRLDPARLCMYVPGGRYKALHLIAVADDRADTIPLVSAQFYRPNAGHPFNFSAKVPTEKGDAFIAAKPLPIKLADGSGAKLYHVTMPLDPDAFSWFTDLKQIGLEITKEVKFFRGYPDPLEYSWHGGGLPSNVQIYAMTLEKTDVQLDLEPDQFGHVWTAPAKPGYSIQLRNGAGAAQTAKLSITTKSRDGVETTHQEQTVSLPADGSTVNIPVKLDPKRYGLHDLEVTLKAGNEFAKYHRSFVYFHPETREQSVWDEGHGPVFGFWPWGGGHVTPPDDKEITVMGAAGAETSTRNYQLSKPEIQELAAKHRFIGESAFFGGVMYLNGFYNYPNAPKFDPTKPEETATALIEAMKKVEAKPSPVSRPTYVPFFAEPQIGTITTGIWPTHYGEPYKLTDAEQQAFDLMKAKYVLGATAIRKQWPNYKLLIPYGDPMNTAIFLQQAPETRKLIDGCALDMPLFERVPEQQIGQVTLNRLYAIMKDVKQHMPNPYLVLIEGFAVSSKDLDTGEEGQAELTMRDFLALMGYGVTRFEAPNSPFDCANYWGENHYGGGWNNRLPLATPKLAYACYGTMTRHLNRANFSKYVPTGSASTFCQQFKHYKTGKLIHVAWTVRGKRPVSVKVPAGATLELYDPSDNVTTLKEKNGVVTFVVNQSPQYLEGLTADAEITLGESDHSDAEPTAIAGQITNLGDGSWKLVEKTDEEYLKNKPLQIERFPGKMTAKSVEAPSRQGGKALAVHLEEQPKDRGVMPFFTTLEPVKPVVIPGKASNLGLWVHAASDWGRFVYSLRDAKGEKWISVGTKEEWNCDDIHAWSHFCFDGWRYLRFQMPSSMPYDSYRERGTSWWGSYGGDGIVDLPLQLEKVIVERRPKVIYGGELIAAKKDDVLLGDLIAEYDTKGDLTDEVVRLSKLRMPIPHDAPALANPIADLQQTGIGEATKALKVTDPTYQFDGTRCHVHFDPVANAKSYDIWVSPYADGRGAIQLGKAWKESGQLLQGLRPEIEFYLFVTYTDADGKVSKPSAPLSFKLKDRFGYK